MRKLITLLLLFTTMSLAGITLDECLQHFSNNHQIPQKLELLQQSEADIRSIALKEWFPKLAFNATYLWSANTMKLGLQEVEKDKTLFELSLTQPIYTGNAIALQKEVEILNNHIQQNRLEDAVFQTKKIIYNLYFNVLLIEKQKTITALSLANYRATQDYIQIRLEAGHATSLDSLIMANLILSQQEAELKLERSKQEVIAKLNEILQSNISSSETFMVPSDLELQESEIQRQELERFALFSTLYDKQKSLNTSQLLPKLNAFVKGNYGNPNYNMYQNEWEENIELGVMFNWNFWNWGKERSRNRILDKQQSLNELDRELFLSQVNNELTGIESAISQVESSLTIKEQQLEITEEITRIFEQSYKLGKSNILTYSDKLTEYQQLQENVILLQIELLFNKYIYNLTAGEF